MMRKESFLHNFFLTRVGEQLNKKKIDIKLHLFHSLLSESDPIFGQKFMVFQKSLEKRKYAQQQQKNLGRHKRSNAEKQRNRAIGVIAPFINLINRAMSPIAPFIETINGAMELENGAMLVIAPFIDSINRALGLNRWPIKKDLQLPGNGSLVQDGLKFKYISSWWNQLDSFLAGEGLGCLQLLTSSSSSSTQPPNFWPRSTGGRFLRSLN